MKKLDILYNREDNTFILKNVETGEIENTIDIYDAKEFFDDNVYTMLLKGIVLKIER